MNIDYSSLKKTARKIGLLYLVLLVCGPFSIMYVPSLVMVPGDAAATVSKILQYETEFRLALASDLIIVISEIFIIVYLYVLLKPVSGPLSLAAALARFLMTAIQAANLFTNLGVLLLLGGASYMAALGALELNTAVVFLLELHQQGVYIWEALFALHCAILGYLIIRADYFPSWLGALLCLAAVGYGLDGFGNMLYPSGKHLFEVIVPPLALAGELPFILWLLIRGIRIPSER